MHGTIDESAEAVGRTAGQTILNHKIVMAYFAMSSLALKWALKAPVTSRYPFAPRRALAGSRGTVEFTPANCVFCTVCAKRCPTGALAVHRAQKRWTIDRLLCITCGLCVEVCPKKSLALGTAHCAPAVTKDRELY